MYCGCQGLSILTVTSPRENLIFYFLYFGTFLDRGVTHHPNGRWEARIGMPGGAPPISSLNILRDGPAMGPAKDPTCMTSVLSRTGRA